MDDYLLQNNGTILNVGSWTRAEPGPDFGAKDLLRSVYAENPRSEGGYLGFEQAGVRRFSFPLTVGSGAVGGLALTAIEELLRDLARPGAVIDLRPKQIASAEMVRFDVLNGRWEPDYHIRHHDSAYRLGTLELDVQPFGYQPTWVLMASAASIGLPGAIAVNGPSVVGDVPGLVAFMVQPTQAAGGAVGTWIVDALAWGLGGRSASFSNTLDGASWIAAISGNYQAGGPGVINATVLRVLPSPTQVGWTQMAYYTIPSGLEPAYRGRYRAFAYLRNLLLAGDTTSLQVSLDAVPADTPSAPMASAAAIATVGVPAASLLPVHQFLDMGELSLPPVGSGYQRALLLRLWGARATTVATTTPITELTGITLIPVDGPDGILPRGMAWPPEMQGTSGRFHIDAYERLCEITMIGGSIASGAPVGNALPYYKGDFPKINPSVVQLDLAAAARLQANPYVNEVLTDTPYAYYRLEETAGQGTMTDSSVPPVRHGTWINAPSLGQPPIIGSPSTRSGYFDGTTPEYGGVASGLIDLSATSFTLEMWTTRQGASQHDYLFGIGSVASYRALHGGYTIDNRLTFGYHPSFNSDLQTAAGAHLDTGERHHLVFRFDRTNSLRDIFKDGVLVASGVGSPFLGGGAFIVGYGGPSLVTASFGFAGGIDEFAIYTSLVSSARINQHYQAGLVSPFPARPGPQRAAVSVFYRPRFAFLKGGI